MSRPYIKRVNSANDVVLERVELIGKLTQISPVFPRIKFIRDEGGIEQIVDPIEAKKWPTDLKLLGKLWHDFKQEVEKVHAHGYVHGDILRKNLLFDGKRIILLDHEMLLFDGKVLRGTFPWIDIEDYRLKTITQRTDNLCIQATELRLFHPNEYMLFRNSKIQFFSELNS